MHAPIINTIVPRMARFVAPATAIAKAPDDGRFCEALQAGAAVEVPVEVTPAAPATPSVGKVPVAMMRPPDVSSPDDTVAKPAARAHEEQHSKSSQDTGAVSVAKEATMKDTNQTKEEPQTLTPEAASPMAALQPLPMPLPVATAAPVVEETNSVAVDAKPVVGASKNVAKKIESAPANVAAGNTGAPIAVAGPQVAAVETKQSGPVAGITISQTHTHPTAVASVVSKSALVVEAAPKSAAPADTHDMKMLIATPNALEVGIATGTHGWLRVRAELGQMGEVTASLAATSASAADGLHKELPTISEYLASERVGVSSLVVNSTDKSTGMASAGEQAGSRDQRQPGSGSTAPNDDDGGGVEFNFMGMNLPAAVYANGSGSWLSVRV